MTNKKEKRGRALEKAVRLIQEAVLKTDPQLKGTAFSMECNKIVSVAGVHHEIDIWVKTLPGSSYESTYIFECKDWKEPVGKNEIIILAEKVKATGANRGFLVARRFSKDAKAQFQSDPRLRCIECTSDFVTPFTIEVLHVIHDPVQKTVSIKERGVPATNQSTALDWKQKPCYFNKMPIDFVSFIDRRVREMLLEYETSNPAKYRAHANHFSDCSQQFSFQPRELLIGELDIEFMIINAKFFVTFQSKKILSRFELKGQGRTFSFEPITSETPGITWEVDVVQKL